jgi:hypothetical protein
MHGLKCAGGFAGWTRLCDEWLIGLDRLDRGGAATPFDTRELALRSVADAAFRTRRFARGADEALDPVAVDAEGVLRFELQGIDYVVAADAWTPGPSEDLVAGAAACLETLLPRARQALAGAEDHPVALVVLAPDLEALASDERRVFVDRAIAAFRDASLTHALAYAFPRASDGADGRYASARHPGCFLLARSGVFG